MCPICTLPADFTDIRGGLAQVYNKSLYSALPYSTPPHPTLPSRVCTLSALL